MKNTALFSAVLMLFIIQLKAQDYSPFSLGHEWVFDIYETGVIAGTDTMRCEQVEVSGDTVFYFVYDYISYLDDRPVDSPEINVFYDGVGDGNNVYVRSIFDLHYFKHRYTDGESYNNFLFTIDVRFLGDYQLPSGELFQDCFYLDFSVSDSTGFVVAPDVGIIAAFEMGQLVRALKFSNVPPVSYQDLEICEGDSILLHERYVYEAGVYRDTLSGSQGDSIVETTLILLPGSEVVIDVSICEGESYMAGGAEQTESGTYYDTLINAAGCDSIVTTNLTVNPVSGSTVDTTICEGESYMAGGAEQTESGTYYDTLVNASGCDSVLTTNLTVEECDTGIPQNGSGFGVRVYPNPTTGLVTIESKSLDYFEVYNLLGKNIRRSERRTFDFSDLPEGCYYLKCYGPDGLLTVMKVIYQR